MRTFATARNPIPVVLFVAKPGTFILRTFQSIDIRIETSVSTYLAIPLQLHFNVAGLSESHHQNK